MLGTLLASSLAKHQTAEDRRQKGMAGEKRQSVFERLSRPKLPAEGVASPSAAFKHLTPNTAPSHGILDSDTQISWGPLRAPRSSDARPAGRRNGSVPRWEGSLREENHHPLPNQEGRLWESVSSSYGGSARGSGGDRGRDYQTSNQQAPRIATGKVSRSGSSSSLHRADPQSSNRSLAGDPQDADAESPEWDSDRDGASSKTTTVYYEVQDWSEPPLRAGFGHDSGEPRGPPGLKAGGSKSRQKRSSASTMGRTPSGAARDGAANGGRAGIAAGAPNLPPGLVQTPDVGEFLRQRLRRRMATLRAGDGGSSGIGGNNSPGGRLARRTLTNILSGGRPAASPSPPPPAAPPTGVAGRPAAAAPPQIRTPARAPYFVVDGPMGPEQPPPIPARGTAQPRPHHETPSRQPPSPAAADIGPGPAAPPPGLPLPRGPLRDSSSSLYNEPNAPSSSSSRHAERGNAERTSGPDIGVREAATAAAWAALARQSIDRASKESERSERVSLDNTLAELALGLRRAELEDSAQAATAKAAAAEALSKPQPRPEPGSNHREVPQLSQDGGNDAILADEAMEEFLYGAGKARAGVAAEGLRAKRQGGGGSEGRRRLEREDSLRPVSPLCRVEENVEEQLMASQVQALMTENWEVKRELEGWRGEVEQLRQQAATLMQMVEEGEREREEVGQQLALLCEDVRLAEERAASRSSSTDGGGSTAGNGSGTGVAVVEAVKGALATRVLPLLEQLLGDREGSGSFGEEFDDNYEGASPLSTLPADGASSETIVIAAATTAALHSPPQPRPQHSPNPAPTSAAPSPDTDRRMKLLAAFGYNPGQAESPDSDGDPALGQEIEAWPGADGVEAWPGDETQGLRQLRNPTEGSGGGSGRGLEGVGGGGIAAPETPRGAASRAATVYSPFTEDSFASA